MIPRPSRVLVTNPDRQLPCHFSKTVLRIPSMGQRSDFSKPCQGAAEKSANATRTAVRFRQGSQRLGMSTKKDAAKPFGLGTFFVVAVQDENRNEQRQGITMGAVSCLLLFLIEYVILGSVQQICIWRIESCGMN